MTSIVTSSLTSLSSAAGRTALHLAAGGGHVDCVRTLLEAGAALNLADNKGGQTALSLAAGGGHLDIVTLLLGRGADLRGDAEKIIRSVW